MLVGIVIAQELARGRKKAIFIGAKDFVLKT